MKNFKHGWLVAGGCLIAVGVMADSGRAAYVSDDNRLPPPVYRGANPVTYLTPGGTYKIDSFFDIFTEIDRFAPPPLPPGASEVHSFFDVFAEFDVSVQSGGSVSPPVHIRESPTLVSFRLNGLPPGVPFEQGYATEMLELVITGSGAPGGLPAGVMIRESPSRPSLGQTRVVGSAPSGGGPFLVDSFFDVFTELSLNGGQTWSQGLVPLHLVGTQSTVPELSSCLVWLVGSLALGYFGFRRANR